uniref:Uncharacterized protein n=1 Tax=Rhizophagus irregularis (strain DAOM 181602 / DAOM 197198 / MUCL 43194) TaxID=747089 RepID=U9T4H3_RHIID
MEISSRTVPRVVNLILVDYYKLNGGYGTLRHFVEAISTKGCFAEAIHRRNVSPKGCFSEGIFCRREVSPKGCFTEGIFRRKDVSPIVHFTESISPNRPFRRIPSYRIPSYRIPSYRKW